MKTFSLEQINTLLKGEIIGNTNQKIFSAEKLEKSGKNQISFIGNKKYEKFWLVSDAAIAIVYEDISIQPGLDRAFIKVKNTDLAMSRILAMFAPALPVFDDLISKTATVHPTAVVGKGTRIGSGCHVGPNVILGENITLYPNVTILDNCIIGENTIIWSGVVVRERCQIGTNCILHPNVSIGADGFGFVECPEKGLVKIPHIGNVLIGNNVEIGANSCVDRGKFSSTIVGDGCKIDNLVQIGHNSILGKFCIMAGHSGLAGSVTLGNGVIIGGSASIRDHVTIGDGATIGAGSGVMANVPAGKIMLGYPAVESRNALKQWALLKRMTGSKIT